MSHWQYYYPLVNQVPYPIENVKIKDDNYNSTDWTKLIKHYAQHEPGWFEEKSTAVGSSQLCDLYNFFDKGLHPQPNSRLLYQSIFECPKHMTPAQVREQYMTDFEKKRMYSNFAWGNEHEIDALATYLYYFAQKKNMYVFEPTFRRHRDYSYLGASTDGLLYYKGLDYGYKRGVLEIKAPAKKSFYYGGLPFYYYPQVLMEMWVMKVNWVHFVVWTPEETGIWFVPFNEDHWDLMLQGILQWKKQKGYLGTSYTEKLKKVCRSAVFRSVDKLNPENWRSITAD